MPPAVSRMLTPEISSAIAKSACVTWRAQPPFWMRFEALLNDAQFCGRPPPAGARGGFAAGNLAGRAGVFWPRAPPPRGVLAVVAACRGRVAVPAVLAPPP